jgi:hypothetical protein
MFIQYVDPPSNIDVSACAAYARDEDQLDVELDDDDITSFQYTRESGADAANRLDANIKKLDWRWMSRHVDFHKYGTTIRKCDDRSCCKEYRCPMLKEMLAPFKGIVYSVFT